MAARTDGGLLGRDHLLISMPEIAELAGVRRPVVTTWRRRHGSFPAPVDNSSATPQFDAHEVAEWLVTTGRAEREQVELELSLYALSSLATELRARDLIAALTALICLRWLDDDEPLADSTKGIQAGLISRAARLDPGDEFLRSEIEQIPPQAAWLAAAVDELVEAAWGCRGAFERVMSARSRFQAADLYSRTVTPELARLIAALSGASERAGHAESIVVADPAAGPGDLMTAVARLLTDQATPVCIGAEPDPYLARLVRRRLVVHAVMPSDVDIRIGDGLADEGTEPDVMVTQIPYAPAERRRPEAIVNWMDDLALWLAPGRSAVILGPADVLTGALQPYSPAERARTAMLTSGVVEAIVRLPGGLVPFRPGYETALWVLTPAGDYPLRGSLLLADLSDLELTDDVIDALVADVIMWRRGGYAPRAHTRAFSAQVRVGDLVSRPGPLTVRRSPSIHEFLVDAAARVAHVTQLESELDRIAAQATAARRSIHSGAVAGSARRPAQETIGSLTRAKRLTVLKGARINPADINETGQHPVVGVPELSGQHSWGHRNIDWLTLADQYPRTPLTEPGDVVITTIPYLNAVVDRDGYSVVEFPARILRIPETEREQLTPAVLAALLTTGDRGVRPASAVRSRRLEQHHLALLSPVEVHLLDMLLEQLDAQLALTQQELDVLTEIRKITAAGLMDGTLTLTGSTGAG